MSAAAPNPPAKLSALLALAVGDMERMMEDDRYHPDSGEWHRPHAPTGRCHACLAGAVLAGTLGAEPTQDMSGTMGDVDYCGDGDWVEALRLVDAWRGGWPDEVLRRARAFFGAAVASAAARTMSDILQDRDARHPAAWMPGYAPHQVELVWRDAETARAALDVLRAEVARLAEAGL